MYILIDEAQYADNWALKGKIIYDKSKKIFLIFTGSSALNLEYNADAARRMIKTNVTPLSYGEHLKLKYGMDFRDMSESLVKLLFEGDCEGATNSENSLKKILINNKDYTSNEWDNYFKYGGFPSFFKETDMRFFSKKIVDMTQRVVNTDMISIKNFTKENQTNANRILNYLSLQRSSEVSQAKLSKVLGTSQSNIKNILDILEQTHLLFHYESYGTSLKRISKPRKYYFATASIKHALSISCGNTMKNTSEYDGILLENLVASSLFNLKVKENNRFNLYYDTNKKGNVDFLIQEDFRNPIPLEVGLGKKDKKQIKIAINHYDSSYGIIVSNSTLEIEKVDNIIYIPPKIFSFLS